MSHIVSIINTCVFVFVPGELTAVDLETHALNVVYIVFNLMVTGIPVRLLHVWYSLVFGVTYTLFTLFYYLAGGTNADENPYVYRVIDWRKPGTAIAVSVVVGIVATTIMHLVIYGLYCLKMFICCNTGCYLSDEQSDTGKGKEVDPETGL